MNAGLEDDEIVDLLAASDEEAIPESTAAVEDALVQAAAELSSDVASHREQCEAVAKIADILRRPSVTMEWALHLQVGDATVGEVMADFCEERRRATSCGDAVATVQSLLGHRIDSIRSARVGGPVPAGDGGRAGRASVVDAAIQAAIDISSSERDTGSDQQDEEGDSDSPTAPHQPAVLYTVSVPSVAHVASDLADPMAPPTRVPWQPGENMHSVVDQRRSLGRQTKALVAGAVATLEQAASREDASAQPVHPNTLQAIPTWQLIRELASRLPSVGAQTKTIAAARDLVSRMMRLSRASVWRCIKFGTDFVAEAAASTNPVNPGIQAKATPVIDAEPRRQRAVDTVDIKASPVPENQGAMRLLVRQIVANASRGHSLSELGGDMSRFDLAGVSVGTKYIHPWFASTVEHIGARVVQRIAGNLIDEPLPALGIPSDMALFLDPGTIGQVFKAIRSTVVICGLTVSHPGSRDGSETFFLGAPTHTIGGEGEEVFLTFLTKCSAKLDANKLRARLAIVNADGAYVAGEASHHAPTSKLLQHLWASVGMPERSGWDEFHRWNKVHKQSVKAVPVAEQFLQLLRDLGYAFGFGQGRVLDRAICNQTGEKYLTSMAPGGNREFVYLARMPARFLAKWTTLYQAVDLRRAHSEDGRTGHDPAWWVELGRRLANAGSPVFALCHGALYDELAQHVLYVQKPGSLPDVRLRSIHRIFEASEGHRKALARLLPWLRVLPFVFNYIGSRIMIGHTVAAMAHACIGRYFRGLPKMLAEMYADGKFRGHAVAVEHDEAAPKNFFVHHACHCCMPRRAHDKITVKQKWPVRTVLGWKGELRSTSEPIAPSQSSTERVALQQKHREFYCWAVSDSGQPWQIRSNLRDPWRFYTEQIEHSWKTLPKISCRVDAHRVQVSSEITTAVQGSLDYFEAMVQQIREYICGDVGLTRDLKLRWDLFSRCYALGDLAQMSVQPQQATEAFKTLYSLALPELKESLLPPVDTFGAIAVPDTPPEEQYRAFSRRLQETWQKEVREWHGSGFSSRGWVKFDGVQVVGLCEFPREAYCCSRAWKWRASWLPWRAGWNISIFAADYHRWDIRAKDMNKLRPTGPIVQARCSELLRPGKMDKTMPGGIWAVPGWSPIVGAPPPWWDTVFRDAPQQELDRSVVAHSKARCKKVLVIVVQPILRPVDHGIASTIETDRSLTDGHWIVARHWHRERHRGITTAPAEGWTGTLGRLWDPLQGRMTGGMIDRLHLAASGFRGAGQDEHVVNAVVASIKGKPFVNRPRASHILRQHRCFGRAASSWLHSEIAIKAAQISRFAPRVPSKWALIAQQRRAPADLADINATDRQVIRRYADRKTRPKLRALSMTKKQRLAYDALSSRTRQLAARVAIRKKRRAMALAKASSAKRKTMEAPEGPGEKLPQMAKAQAKSMKAGSHMTVSTSSGGMAASSSSNVTAVAPGTAQGSASALGIPVAPKAKARPVAREKAEPKTKKARQAAAEAAADAKIKATISRIMSAPDQWDY